MILFSDDWLDHSNAIIDTNTKNISFLRIATLYKEMGIKNHAFPLALFNKDLLKVDPFDPNLSIEEMTMVAIECKQNFMYYIREIARAPGGTKENPILFKANRGNIALFWLFFNHVTTMLIQIRQTGKSFSVDTLMTFLLNIGCTNTQINLLTKDDTLRSANLERLKEIEFELPYYLKQRNKNDIGNTEELSIKSLGNKYKAHLPNKSPKMALNVGRGLTSPIFHIDEASFFFNIAISMPAALAAGTAAREIAKQNDEPYGTIITTTVGKLDDRDGRYVHNLLMNSAIWTEKLFDSINREQLYSLIRNSSKNRELRVNCTFNHRQLGYTDEWLRNAVRDAIAEGEDAERDFLNIWTSGSQSSPLSVAVAKIIRESQVNDFYNEISSPYSYITRWYIKEYDIDRHMNSGHHILSLDTSDAAGGDDIGLTLRDIKTGSVIASGNYNETNLLTFSEWLCSWFVRFANFTLVIERRSTGAMILDYLLLMLPSKGIDPFRRIYNKAVQEYDDYPDRFKEIDKPVYMLNANIYTKFKKLFGFATSAVGATSRSDLYGSTLQSAAKVTGNSVRDSKTINQILGLIIKNGRVDHPDGENDDLCISWLLSYWILIHGKKLSHYGINSKDILSDNVVNNIENNSNTIFENRERDRILNEIETLTEEVKKERDDFIAYKLEIQIKNLISKLNNDDRNKYSIDNLINSIKEHRNLNRKKQFRFY